MLGIKFKAKIKFIKLTGRLNQEQFNTEGLKDTQTQKQFRCELENRFQGLELQEDIEASWNQLKNICSRRGWAESSRKKTSN